LIRPSATAKTCCRSRSSRAETWLDQSGRDGLAEWSHSYLARRESIAGLMVTANKIRDAIRELARVSSIEIIMAAIFLGLLVLWVFGDQLGTRDAIDIFRERLPRVLRGLLANANYEIIKRAILPPRRFIRR
jgi:hypothetical protein